MLVLSRIVYGMLFGVFLICVSEACLADQDAKPFMEDKLMITHRLIPLYKVTDAFAVVGAYRHYEDSELSVNRVFLGLRQKF
jgi:hypothetical protein